MALFISKLATTATPSDEATEFVELKGLGHPDTICDHLAEEVAKALCRTYLQKTGRIAHFNVDKALLVGGQAEPRFGGGVITTPIEIFMAGRAVNRIEGEQIPLDAIVRKTCDEWLGSNLPQLDTRLGVKVHNLIRPGSADLQDLYERRRHSIPRANDTSFGVGYAPLSPLEHLVLTLNEKISDAAFKKDHPAYGEDLKIMAVRRGDDLALTVACAMVSRHLQNESAYLKAKEELAKFIASTAKLFSKGRLDIAVNAADCVETKSFYLTVTGTSAENGDDGEVGRGNRVNGLITPYRPMSLEAAAGKNPVSHVGKMYNLVARDIAGALVESIPEVSAAECYLVSQIGRPINEPAAIDVKVQTHSGADLSPVVQKNIEVIVASHLNGIGHYWEKWLYG